MNDYIFISHLLDGTGFGKFISEYNKAIFDDPNFFIWLHMDANSPKTRDWLQNNVNDVDSLVIDALLADETRPRMLRFNNGILLTLRGVNLNENSTPEDMVSIRLWADNYRIISTAKRKLRAIGDIDDALMGGIGPKNVGEFICMLVNNLLPVLTDLDEIIDNIEEGISENVDNYMRETIVDVRKKAIIFRRYMAPQRDAMERLRTIDISWINEGHKRQLQEAHNHVTRYVEDLDAIRERAQIIKDEIANLLTDKLNKNMYLLSVIAAIFLPLGFLTGLFGINLSGIPGADNPNSFWLFSIILIVIIVAQIILFKKLKWF